MDTPPPQPSNIRYYLRPNQLVESPNNPFTSLIDVNIFGSYNTTCTAFPVKSNSGTHLGTDRSDAEISTTKRDDDCTTKFLFVSSTTSNITAVVPIQTSAPPISKMGCHTPNTPPVPGTDRDLQDRGLLRRRALLDADNTNKQTAQCRHQLGHTGFASVIDFIDVSQ